MSSKRALLYLFIYVILAMAVPTASPAAPVYAAPDTAQLAALGLRDAELTEKDSAVWTIRLNGKEAGTLISTERFGRGIQGYADEVPMLLYLTAEGKVGGVLPLPNREDEGFFGQATYLLHQWDGLPAADALGKQVDVVSGATYSSAAIIGNVQAGLDYYVNGSKEDAADGFPWLPVGAGVIAIGIIIYFLLMRRRVSTKKP